jgi:hypothetical protein
MTSMTAAEVLRAWREESPARRSWSIQRDLVTRAAVLRLRDGVREVALTVPRAEISEIAASQHPDSAMAIRARQVIAKLAETAHFVPAL